MPVRYTVTGTHEPLHNFAFAGATLSMRKSARCVKHACTKSHALRTSTAILRGAPRPRLRVFRMNARVKVGRGAVAPCRRLRGRRVCALMATGPLLPRSPLAISFPSNGPTDAGGTVPRWYGSNTDQPNGTARISQGGQVRSRRWRKQRQQTQKRIAASTELKRGREVRFSA